VNWSSLTRRLPPVMERSLADDLRVAFGVLLGGTLAWLLLGAHHVGLILGGVAGCVLFIVGVNVVRRVRSRRET
jgi:hypothetical protein